MQTSTIRVEKTIELKCFHWKVQSQQLSEVSISNHFFLFLLGHRHKRWYILHSVIDALSRHLYCHTFTVYSWNERSVNINLLSPKNKREKSGTKKTGKYCDFFFIFSEQKTQIYPNPDTIFFRCNSNASFSC